MLGLSDVERTCRARLEKAFVRRLYLRGVRPDQLTVASLGLSILGGALTPVSPRMAAAALVGAAMFDILDGGLARSTGEASPAGALLESTAQRYGEFAALFGAWGRLARLGLGTVGGALALLALQGSLMAKYARARAEALGQPLPARVFEKPRPVLVCALLVSPWETAVGLGGGGALLVALFILAAGANITAMGQIFRARRVLRSRRR